MRLPLRSSLVALALLTLPRLAAATTVGIAPLVTGSSPEYGWIGQALADALSMRIHQQPELNAITTRQINAAMKHDAIAPEKLADEATGFALGRQLGTDVFFIGSYSCAWPDVDVVFKALDPQKQKVLNTFQIQGGLEDLFALEARLADTVARHLGATQPDVTPGAFGTNNLRAWRLTTLAEATINWQSLSPQAADPKAGLTLPEPALKQARAQLEEATRFDPDYGEAWAALGVAQALLGDSANAWKSFGKATALGSGHNPTAVLGASFVRMREGRWDDAISILHNAIQRHPGFLHARGYLGELFNHMGRHREAHKVFDGYAERVPKQPWVLAQRGYTKSKLRQYDAAIADSIAAVDILPDSPSLLLQLASRYIDAGKLVGAEDALMHAMQKNPNHARIYIRLGYVYLLQGKDDLVAPITEKAIVNAQYGARGTDLVYAHLNLARAYGRSGKLDLALEHLGKAKAAGLLTFGEIEADPKLEGLRKDPRYKKLAGS